jgi:hypothetical protein
LLNGATEQTYERQGGLRSIGVPYFIKDGKYIRNREEDQKKIANIEGGKRRTRKD